MVEVGVKRIVVYPEAVARVVVAMVGAGTAPAIVALDTEVIIGLLRQRTTTGPTLQQPLSHGDGGRDAKLSLTLQRSRGILSDVGIVGGVLPRHRHTAHLLIGSVSGAAAARKEEEREEEDEDFTSHGSLLII